MKMAFLLKALVLILIVFNFYLKTPRMTAALNRQVSSGNREYVILPEEAYLKLQEDEIDIAVGSLIIAKGIYPDINIKKYLNQIDIMAKDLEPRLKTIKDPYDIVKTISRYLFVEQKFRFHNVIEARFINNVLDNKCGQCQSLSCLYLSITERLQLPFYGVAAPEHMFIRYDDGSVKINVETKTGGEIRSDKKVLESFGIFSSLKTAQESGYFKNLTKRQFLSHYLELRGITFTEKGNFDKALEDYNKAIDLDPNFAQAYYNRGLQFQDKEDFDKAIQDYTKAISVDQKYKEAYYNRGNAFMKEGDSNKAIQDYSKAISIDTKYADAYYNRGSAYEGKGDIDKAVEDYSKAINSNSKLIDAYLARGNLFHARGESDKAIQDYTKAIFADPKFAKAYYNRGSLYFNKGDIDKAIIDYTEAINLDQQYTTAYYNRGRALASKGIFDKALSDFSHAIAIDSKVADFYFYRATVYFFKGDKKNALKDSKKAIELDSRYKSKIKNVLGQNKEYSDDEEFKTMVK
jgi:tetratricopeptide (TPR) repeat protein